VFVSTLTEKLLIYALGRGVEPSDMPAIRLMTKALPDDHYRFSSLVVGLVKSLPFQMRTAAASVVDPGVRKTAAR
jgi:hypothetical protein